MDTPDQSKARKAIAVPLSAAAVIVIREQIGKHPTHVFSYHGNPIVQLNTAWRKALAKANEPLPPKPICLTVHRDLRHLARLRVALDWLTELYSAPEFRQPDDAHSGA